MSTPAFKPNQVVRRIDNNRRVSIVEARHQARTRSTVDPTGYAVIYRVEDCQDGSTALLDARQLALEHIRGCDGGKTCQRWLPCDCPCHEAPL